MRLYYFYSALAVVFALSLTSCGNSNIKQQLGMERTAPDEFSVYKRAPLELPPDYALRPPRPGAARPQEEKIIEQARESMIGSQGEASVEKTQGEALILQKAGAVQANENIRVTVDQEKDEAAKKKQPVIQRLLNSSDAPGDAPATVVDPEKEAERLKTNKQTGKSVSEGKTPVKVQ